MADATEFMSGASGDYAKKLAMMLAQKGLDTSPVQSPWQGAARMAQALMGGFAVGDDNRQKGEANEMMASLLGGGGAPAGAPPSFAPATPGAPPSPGPASAAPSFAPPSPRIPPMPDRVYSQDEMNPMDAAVASPKELAAGVNAPPQYAALIGKAAIDNDIPANILAAQTKQESGFNPNAVSSAGAQGISQFMPGTAKEMGINPLDPNQAIPAQGQYLRQQVDRFGGSLPQALAAYNAGPGRVAGAGGDISKLPAETQNYVRTISGANNVQTASADPNFTPQMPGAPPPSGNPQLAQALGGPPAAAPPVPATGGGLQLDRATLTKMLANPYTAPFAQQYIQKQITPVNGVNVNGHLVDPRTGKEMADFSTPSTSTVGDTVINNRNGQPIYQGQPKPNIEYMKDDNGRIVGLDKTKIAPGTDVTPPPATPSGPSSIPPAPPGVDPKIWRETFSKNAAAGATPGSFDDTAKLRHEFTQLPSYKNMSQAAPIYQSMRDAAGRDTKAADLNIVYGLGKIMDPGSVVREGEVVLANNAQGWQEKLNGYIAQIQSKGALTPEGRQALMAEAYGRINAYKSEFDRDAGRYKGITERNRITTADVIPEFGGFEPWTVPQAAAPAAPAGKPPVAGPQKTKSGVTWSVE